MDRCFWHIGLLSLRKNTIAARFPIDKNFRGKIEPRPIGLGIYNIPNPRSLGRSLETYQRISATDAVQRIAVWGWLYKNPRWRFERGTRISGRIAFGPSRYYCVQGL